MLPPNLKKPCFLQLRAGKMSYANGIVTANPAKGYLSFHKKKSTAEVEIIWSGEGGLEEVHTVKAGVTNVSFVEKCTTGRVLLFESPGTGENNERLFFWLQDRSSGKDNEFLSKIKESLTVSTASVSGPTIQPEDFRRIIASISTGNEISLTDVISSPKVVESLRADPDFYSSRLRQFFPPGVDNSDLIEQVKNPQAFRAAATLDAALKDPQTCREVCRLYGLPETVSGISGFLQAIMKLPKK